MTENPAERAMAVIEFALESLASRCSVAAIVHPIAMMSTVFANYPLVTKVAAH